MSIFLELKNDDFLIKKVVADWRDHDNLPEDCWDADILKFMPQLRFEVWKALLQGEDDFKMPCDTPGSCKLEDIVEAWGKANGVSVRNHYNSREWEVRWAS